MKEIKQPFTRCLLNLFTCPLCLSSLRDEKPTPQENNSEVLKALQDDELSITGVAGMAELQEDRYESMKNEILFHVSALLSTILISFSFDFLNYSNMTTLHLAHSF